MTFWDFLRENKTKLLGTATTVVAALLSMIALGMFNADANSPALLEPLTIRWMTVVLSLLNVALGGGTVAAGLSNTTRERVAIAAATVAASNAEVAAAMETAIKSKPQEAQA